MNTKVEEAKMKANNLDQKMIDAVKSSIAVKNIVNNAISNTGYNLGLAIVTDALSTDHRNYLAAGGTGFELGDGKLNYGQESAAEFYYSFKPTASSIWLTADYQFVVNPGYNKDRGPVNVFSLRLHIEL